MRFLLDVFTTVLVLFFVVPSAFAQTEDPLATNRRDPFAPSTSRAPTQAQAQKPALTATQTKTQRPAGVEREYPKGRETVAKIYSALALKADLVYEESPWSKVEEDLELRYGFNIVLTSSAEDDSLTPDEPVTVNLKGVSLSRSLQVMLEMKNATYVVQDEVIKIISLDDAGHAHYFARHMIKVEPLLALISSREGARIGKPKKSTNKSPTVSDDKKQKPVLAAAHQASPDDLISAESLLIDLIQQSVAPGNWRDTGQGHATVKILGGCLTVNSTESVA